MCPYDLLYMLSSYWIRLRKSWISLESYTDRLAISFLAIRANFLLNLLSNIYVNNFSKSYVEFRPVSTTF